MRFRIALALETAMLEPEVETWTLELLEEAALHLLAGETIEIESIQDA